MRNYNKNCFCQYIIDEEGFITNRRNLPNYWLKLPRDIIMLILQKVGVLESLRSVQLVCTQWREICTDPSTWATTRVVDWFSYWTPQLNLTSDEYTTRIENIISREVDQSCGSLFNLDLDKLMSKRKLHYVVERSIWIRHLLGVPRCFIERVASRLPLLEKFELVGICSTLSLDAIVTLGRYLPKLSSLKINVYGNEEAKTIARSMPQLRHICFPGENLMTDVGVEALLDGCPHLESLDIQKCYFFELTKAFRMMENLPLTRTQWRDALDDPSIWSTFFAARIFGFKSFLNQEEFKFMIRRAVDKSFGGLVDLDLGIYMSVDILSYVVNRCTQIRRLHRHIPVFCPEEAIRAAVARLPLLEDLGLYYYSTLSVETIETLGRCCPKLTSLEICIDDDGAKTIARSLPHLRHLNPMSSYELTEVGVEALLDGCPHLEFLNLRFCFSVRLCKTLMIKCVEKIKDFRSPCSTCCRSTKSYEYDLGYDQFFEEDEYDLGYDQFFEEDVYGVDYPIHQ